jgi:hypothetical protein
MLARMYERRLKGYCAIGYSIEEQQTADLLLPAIATDG